MNVKNKSKSPVPAKRPAKKSAWGVREKKRCLADAARELAFIETELSALQKRAAEIQDVVETLMFQRMLIRACRALILQH